MSGINLSETLRVPVIMGRGEAYGVVIGEHLLNEFMSLGQENSPSVVDSKAYKEKILYGKMPVVITSIYPDTFFAFTESEHTGICERFGVIRKTCTKDEKLVRQTSALQAVVEWLGKNDHTGDIDLHYQCYACQILELCKAALSDVS